MTKKGLSMIFCLSAILLTAGVCVYTFIDTEISTLGMFFAYALAYVYMLGTAKAHIAIPVLAVPNLLVWFFLLWIRTEYLEVAVFEFFGMSISVPVSWLIEFWFQLMLLCVCHVMLCLIYGSWSRVAMGIRQRKEDERLRVEAEGNEKNGQF